MLVDVAAQVGLDRDEARQVLEDKSHVERVRERQSVWTSQGISGVPSMIFAGKYLVTGAQGVDNYVQILEKVVQEMSAA